MKRTAARSVLPAMVVLIASSCGDGGGEEQAQQTEPDPGTLTFLANGEDFVQNGFVSKDGWDISFRHVWITVDNVEAHQTDPPFDPHSESSIVADETVYLDGPVTVDLFSPDAPVVLGVVDAPAGHYNAISWDLVPAASGPSEGYSIFVEGQAEKGDLSYQVFLGVEDSFRFMGGEYVGDERLGFVEPGGEALVEMTFHFDHIFGDGGIPEDDPLNLSAAGFEPFAGLMQEGTVSTDLEGIRAALGDGFHDRMIDILKTLGHTGEGHCLCIVI